MLPVIALVGRPNVGKSTLFNSLTRTRDALVHNQPGLTRDRLYGQVKREGEVRALVVDTGGLGDDSIFAESIDAQVQMVLREADEILFILDFADGISPRDEEIALMLRKAGKPIHAIVNKSEGVDSSMAVADFQRLGGVESVWPISAKRGDRVELLLESLLNRYPAPIYDDADGRIRIAIIGRPNVGKSTLINALVGEERVIVLDQPGTTRDSVLIPFEKGKHRFDLVDTAGMRRKKTISDTIEQFSVVKTIQAIERANVCILMLDGQREPGDQDAALAGMVETRGRSIMVVINKWDNLESYQRKRFLDKLDRRFPFLPTHETIKISALHGTAVGDVLPAAVRAYNSAMKEFTTSDLNRRLEKAVEAQAPPMHGGNAIKLKFAHQEDTNPPSIVIRGNRLEHISPTYTRYLTNYLQSSYKLVGTRVNITYKTEDNPYAGRKRSKHR
jgi:GTPase